jgi:hypothetical protein
MMKVRVQILKSVIGFYPLAKSIGDFAVIDSELAEKILEEHPGMISSPVPLEEEKPPVVKDTQVKKAKTRPVTREKSN